MSCCNNYLGKFAHNDEIDTGIIATVAGAYVFKFDYLNAGFEIQVEGIIDERLIIPSGQLNENFTYHFTVEDPNGDAVELNECEDFSLKVFVNLIPCADDCDTSVYL